MLVRDMIVTSDYCKRALFAAVLLRSETRMIRVGVKNAASAVMVMIFSIRTTNHAMNLRKVTCQDGDGNDG
jgi:hypothetical protein